MRTKGIFEVLYCRRTFRRPDYADDIETARKVLGTSLREIVPGGHLDTAALLPPDGLERLRPFVGRSSLDLDEDNRVSIQGYKVYFPDMARVVCSKDPVPAFLAKEASGCSLAAPAK